MRGGSTLLCAASSAARVGCAGAAWPDTAAAALFPVLEAAAANELGLVVGRLNLLSVFNKKIIVTPCEISSRTTYVISG